MQDIKDLLPHREPFLFVDRVEKADKDEIVGYRKFTETDFFFAGHFPSTRLCPVSSSSRPWPSAEEPVYGS